MFRILTAVVVFMTFQDAYGYNMKKCFDYQTKSATWRKYDFKYLAPTTHPSDSVNVSVPTDTTSKEGLSKWSNQNSIQGSTMMIDPGVSTKSSTGQSQFISSWGECSMLGYKDQLQKRNNFVAGNWEELHSEIAIGRGAHLQTLLSMSGCRESLQIAVLANLRQNYQSYTDAADFVSYLDQLLLRFPFFGCRSEPTAAE
jgi:hypothetical protein